MVQGECADMRWREVRSRRGNKLLFRYCPETDEIEILTRFGDIEIVRLDDHRPAHQRRFSQPIDKKELMCYSDV